MSAAPHHARWRAALNSVADRIATVPAYQASGRVVRAAGLVLEAVGLRVPLGSACRIELSAGFGEPAGFAEAEVVGFSGDNLFLMPLAEISGLTPGARVFPLGHDGAGARRFPLGDDLLGRVVDGNGRPLDDGDGVDDAPTAPSPRRR
ncbi:Flagellum-specific ATP synthase [Alcanivorax sp. ALC70]|nr:Flagellum-specific ATP synthase [Alcanivorax sp. ALC70]